MGTYYPRALVAMGVVREGHERTVVVVGSYVMVEQDYELGCGRGYVEFEKPAELELDVMRDGIRGVEIYVWNSERGVERPCVEELKGRRAILVGRAESISDIAHTESRIFRRGVTGLYALQVRSLASVLMETRWPGDMVDLSEDVEDIIDFVLSPLGKHGFVIEASGELENVPGLDGEAWRKLRWPASMAAARLRTLESLGKEATLKSYGGSLSLYELLRRVAGDLGLMFGVDGDRIVMTADGLSAWRRSQVYLLEEPGMFSEFLMHRQMCGDWKRSTVFKYWDFTSKSALTLKLSGPDSGGGLNGERIFAMDTAQLALGDPGFAVRWRRLENMKRLTISGRTNEMVDLRGRELTELGAGSLLILRRGGTDAVDNMMLRVWCARHELGRSKGYELHLVMHPEDPVMMES